MTTGGILWANIFLYIDKLFILISYKLEQLTMAREQQ